MIDTRVDPLVIQARRLVDIIHRNNETVKLECERRIRTERIWISSICLGIILGITISSFFI